MPLECKLIATVTLIADGKVLLVRYKDMPDHQQGWFLPHDLLEKFEHPAAAVTRSLRLQFLLDADQIELRHVESFKGRDGTWHLAFHYLGRLQTQPAVMRGEMLSATEWFDLNELPPRDEVAHHGWALDTIDAVCSQSSG